MGKKDSVTKKYMQNNEIFADVFNFYGEQVIKPEQLKPLDTTAIALPYKSGTQSVPVQKFRDVLKFMTAKADDNAAYLLLGIEKFRTDLQLIFQSIKYSEDRQKMQNILENNPAYSQLIRETAEMISVTTNTKIKLKKGEEFFDMCKAFSDMKEEGRAEGRVEGIREGEHNSAVVFAKKLLKRNIMSIEEIAEDTGLSVDEVKSIAEKMKKL